jgi:hypothetical protein
MPMIVLSVMGRSHVGSVLWLARKVRCAVSHEMDAKLIELKGNGDPVLGSRAKNIPKSREH